MTEPLVSVILCGYNQGRFIRDAIESVRAQTYSPVELIIIDNGSTDDTRRVLEPYRDLPGVRVLLYEENESVSRRMNQGLAASSGDFISILYADDLYLPAKTERQIISFQRLGPEYGVVYSPGYRQDVLTGRRWQGSTIRASGMILSDLLRSDRAFINPISPLVRRACFDEYPFHEDVFTEGEDHYFFLALRYKFFYLDEPLVVMREHRENMGKAYRLNFDNGMATVDRLEREPAFPPGCRPLLVAYRARARARLAWKTIRLTSDRAFARRMLGEAIAMDRGQLLMPKTLIAAALAILPEAMCRAVNRLIDSVRRNRSSRVVRESYLCW